MFDIKIFARCGALSIIGFVAFTISAAADPAPVPESSNLSAKYLACHARAHGETVQQSVCAQVEIAAQDDRLNKAYQRVMHQLAGEPERKSALRKEELSWLAERDYKCKVNGTTINVTCLVGKTAARADQLESQIHF